MTSISKDSRTRAPQRLADGRSALRHIAFRVSTDDLNVIDRAAHDRGLSRTQFLIATATGRGLPLAISGTEQRVEDLERRVAGVERSLSVLGLGGDDR